MERNSYRKRLDLTVPFPEIYDIVACSNDLASGIKKNKDSFLLYSNDSMVESLLNQVKIGEKANRQLVQKLSLKDNNTVPQGFVRRILRKLKM